MRQAWTIIPLIAVGAILATDSALAWSSAASRTLHNMHYLDQAIQLFYFDNGRYPNAKDIKRELLDGEYLVRDSTRDALRDDWGRALIYRTPGVHGAYDLYSTGADGIDDGGSKDDVSIWAGVNEGFHWKSGWPRGRHTLTAACSLGLIVLFTGYWFRWRFVLPVVGSIVSLGVVIGCGLLLHRASFPTEITPHGVDLFCNHRTHWFDRRSGD